VSLDACSAPLRQMCRDRRPAIVWLSDAEDAGGRGGNIGSSFDAESHGRYFLSNIRDKFRCETYRYVPGLGWMLTFVTVDQTPRASTHAG
jgi:hypothetical protein